MDQPTQSTVEVDARGLSCPIPVIRVKDAIAQNPGVTIRVLIEDQETEENVTRLAEGLGLMVSKPAPDAHDLVLSPGRSG
jgi:TusA-related sulfurtransferase